MNADADCELAVRSAVAAERPLQLHRRMHSGLGAGERRQEAIALEPHDRAVVVGNELLDQHTVIGQQSLPAFRTQLFSRRIRIGDV